VAESRPLAEVPHGFLTALTLAGARVIHPDAARLAEQHQLTLEFHSLRDASPATLVRPEASAEGLRAVATLVGGVTDCQVTAISGRPADAAGAAEALRDALLAAGIEVRDVQPAANGPRFIVREDQALAATAALHRAFVLPSEASLPQARRAS
jgi:aspartokinase